MYIQGLEIQLRVDGFSQACAVVMLPGGSDSSAIEAADQPRRRKFILVRWELELNEKARVPTTRYSTIHGMEDAPTSTPSWGNAGGFHANGKHRCHGGDYLQLGQALPQAALRVGGQAYVHQPFRPQSPDSQSGTTQELGKYTLVCRHASWQTRPHWTCTCVALGDKDRLALQKFGFTMGRSCKESSRLTTFDIGS